MQNQKSIIASLLVALGAMLGAVNAYCGPSGTAGPYHIIISSEPTTLPLSGRATLIFRISDVSGKPLDHLVVKSLTKMQDMNMGEREETAIPVEGHAGTYSSLAQFAMEGAFETAIMIDGPLGPSATKIGVHTGQNLAESDTVLNRSGLLSVPNALMLVVVVAILAFTIARMRATGQRISFNGANRSPILGGMAMLVVTLLVAVYAVNHERRPGAWTPIEAQAMEMNLPAPVGIAPVELATVFSAPIRNTVRYSGQAVGFVEQDVSPRVQGVITGMPVYVGDHIRRGQLIVRLDTTQSAPQVAAQRGQLRMAQQAVEVAKKDYLQAQAMVHEADAEVGMKTGEIEAARADVTTAEQARVTAQDQVDAMQTQIADANAQLEQTRSDQRYWQSEIARESNLLKEGAVTREEYEREKTEVVAADSKVKQAEAHLLEVKAQVRAAESEVLKSESVIASARSKLNQMQIGLNAHHAHVHSASAEVESAHQKIAEANAGVDQARAVLDAVVTIEGYSEIRSEIDGEVSQRVTSPGTLVSPGQTLLRIVQTSPIRLQANVPTSDLASMRVGSVAEIEATGGDSHPLPAHVTSIQPGVDSVARTGVVEIVLPNTDRHFLPGQYVSIEISTTPEHLALQVPTRALRYHTIPSGDVVSATSMPTVWVAEPLDGSTKGLRVHEVTVTVGCANETYTEIKSGLQQGQVVVAAGMDNLKDGDAVAPITEDEGGSSTSVARTTNPEGTASSGPSPTTVARSGQTKKPTLYTCLMHPEVVLDHPGKCPKCGMTLVVKLSGDAK